MFFFLLLFFIFSCQSLAEDNICSTIDGCKDKIKEYEQKISELQGQQKTLKATINYFNNKINLTNAKIGAIQQELKILNENIKTLSIKIEILNESIVDASGRLASRIEATYKRGRIKPFYLFFSSHGFSDFLSRLKYLQMVQLYDRRLLFRMQELKMNFDSQKKLKEEKQAEEKKLQKQLLNQKFVLAQQKGAKQSLLATTKNNESKYQQLLSAAIAEVQSLENFALSHGGDICLSSPQAQPDGWYWNQRDSRWCKQTIGSSSENVGTVGCLISSVAMIWTKYGQTKTPAQIASDSNYFFSNTAYMLKPPPVPNYTSQSGYDPDFIDNKLASGQPVIVHLNLGGDGHFIVLKSGSKGNYVMNDPWQGPDLNLSDYYSVYAINSMFTFHP